MDENQEISEQSYVKRNSLNYETITWVYTDKLYKEETQNQCKH